eukprot:7185466-Prymnesium_polylepis.1
MVVGAKSDAGAPAAVSEAEAEAFANKYGALCERCSARDATNVRPMFERLAIKIVRNGFDPDGKVCASAAVEAARVFVVRLQCSARLQLMRVRARPRRSALRARAASAWGAPRRRRQRRRAVVDLSLLIRPPPGSLAVLREAATAQIVVECRGLRRGEPQAG